MHEASYRAIYYGGVGVAALLGSKIIGILGGWDEGILSLCICMSIDYVLGISCALLWQKSPKSAHGAFESKANMKGLVRKIAILGCVAIAHLVDRNLQTDFTRDGVILFFVANEGFSIIETLGIMGVPLPTQLKKAFELLRSKSEQ